VPVTTAHIPVPVTGVLALRVAVLAHTVCTVPALETVGGTSLVTVTVLADAGHTPFEIVHTNWFDPLLKPVTELFGKEVLITDAVPVITVQRPVPIAGVLALRVAVVEHTVCVVPAFDNVGGISRITVTVLVDAGQTPFEIVHTNLFVPLLKPVTGLFEEAGLTTEAVPVTTVHTAVPVTGVLALRVAVLAHTVCVVPALDAVGGWLTVIRIEELLEVLAHEPVTFTVRLK